MNVSKVGFMSEIPALRKVHLMVTPALIRLTHLCVKIPNSWTATQTRQSHVSNTQQCSWRWPSYSTLSGRTSTSFKGVVTSTQQSTTQSRLQCYQNQLSHWRGGKATVQTTNQEWRASLLVMEPPMSPATLVQPCCCKVKRCLKRLQFNHKPVKTPAELGIGAFAPKPLASGTVATKCFPLKLGTSLTSHRQQHSWGQYE